MGHGVRSALITSMIRGLVEEHGQAAADPGELLTRVNRALALILKQAGHHHVCAHAPLFVILSEGEGSRAILLPIASVSKKPAESNPDIG